LDGLRFTRIIRSVSRRNYINDEEARQLSGEYSLVKAAKIQAMGPKYVVIKKGEHGALLFHDQMYFCASIAVRRSIRSHRSW
jgi:sugar/nucleoside kinase (ribokinase family)